VIAGIVENLNDKIQFIFEIFTIVLLFFIIFLHFLKPIILKIYIKRYLHNFWGSNIITSKIFIIDDIVLEPGWNSEIVNPKIITNIELNEIGWNKSNIFNWKLKLNIEVLKRTSEEQIIEGTEYLDFYIFNILINIKENNIRLSSLMMNAEDDNQDKLFYIDFKRNDNKALWSGSYPEFPFYGEWIWEKKVKETKTSIKEVSKDVSKDKPKDVSKDAPKKVSKDVSKK